MPKRGGPAKKGKEKEGAPADHVSRPSSLKQIASQSAPEDVEDTDEEIIPLPYHLSTMSYLRGQRVKEGQVLEILLYIFNLGRDLRPVFFACTYKEERGPSDEPDFVWTAVRLCIADPEVDVANSIVDYVSSMHNMEVVKLYDLYHCVIPDQHHRNIQLNYLVTVKDSASSTGGGRFPDPSVTRTSWLYSLDLNNGQKYGIGISEEFRKILRPMEDPAHAWTTTHIRSVIALVRSIKRGNIKQAAAEEKDDKERGLRIKTGMPGLMIEDGQQRR